MPVTALALTVLTAATTTLSGSVTLTGANAEDYPYTVSFLCNDVTAATVSGLAFTSSSITIASSTAPTTFTISGLTNGQLYSISAYDANGSISPPQTGTPSSAPIAPVIALSSTDETTATISINYGANQGSDCIASSTLFYKVVDSATVSTFLVPAFVYSDATSPFSKSVTITGLTLGSQYEFALNTKNSIGLSPLSNTVSATPSNVANAPGIPVLTVIDPNASNMAAISSAVAQPSDTASFVTAGATNLIASVSKFKIYTDFYKDTVFYSRVENVFTPTSSSGTYTGAYTWAAAVLQIPALQGAFTGFSTKSVSVMTTGNNTNNISDQSSATSSTVYVVGDVAASSSSFLSNIRTRQTIASSAGSGTGVIVSTWFYSATALTATGTTAFSAASGLTSTGFEVDIKSSSDDLTNTNMADVSAANILYSSILTIPLTTDLTSYNWGVAMATFTIPNADVSKLADYNFRSIVTQTSSGNTFYTRYRSAPITSIPPFPLGSKKTL